MSLPYRLFSTFGADQWLWRLDRRRLRILCYHGICDDRLAQEPWMPHFFVTQSAFENQLRYLTKNATLLPLSQAVRRLQDGSLPAGSLSITFDDGYANNLHQACPLLRKYAAPATIFLSSEYMMTGEFFPFLKLRLIRLWAQQAGIDLASRPLIEYKSNPLERVLEAAALWWRETESQLTEQQRRTLRPLTVDEVRAADPELIEFGAHSHKHCILNNEDRVTRGQEIRISIREVGNWTGRPTALFSYPNGQRGDFGREDQEVLRSAGVQAAVTAIPGANGRGANLLELRRFPVGLYHDDGVFAAEVTGFRTAILAAAGRRV